MGEKFKKMYDATALFFKEVKVEMQKVSWPSKPQIINYTMVVLAAIVFVSVLIGIEDKILGWLLNQFLNL